MSKQHLDSSIFGEDSTRTAPQITSQAAMHRAARQRRRRRGGRRLVVLLLTLALVGAASFMAYGYLRPIVDGLTESKDFPGPGTGSVAVVVHPGDTGRSIADTLFKAGVVKTPKAFSDAAEANPAAASIQPGRYTLRSQMSGTGALGVLLNPANRTVPRVTVREGLRVSEVFAALSKATGRPVADYATAAKDPAALGLPAVAKGNLEGYLFPDSYEFEPDAGAAAQLRRMVTRSVDELEKLGVPPDRYTRVLTVASIIEAEARLAQDRPKVARVIENRLAVRQKLELDTTVDFATNKRGKVTTTDADRATRSPYNTYLVQGLPPGPIDSPGTSSIKAALAPASGAWMFFVAVNPDTGETRYAVDFAGHEANVAILQKWLANNKK